MASTRTVRAICAPVVQRLSACGGAVRRSGARLLRSTARHGHGHGGSLADGAEESTRVPSTRLTFEELVASGRFVRDSHLGGVLHRGHISLREDSPRGSLHVSVKEGNRISVHLDRYSPLGERRARRWGSRSRYSVVRVILHNVGIWPTTWSCW